MPEPLQKPRDCYTCKHLRTVSSKEPCKSCRLIENQNWTPVNKDQIEVEAQATGVREMCDKEAVDYFADLRVRDRRTA